MLQWGSLRRSDALLPAQLSVLRGHWPRLVARSAAHQRGAVDGVFRPLQTIFIEVSKCVTNEEEAISLVAAVEIMFQEAIVIACRHHNDTDTRIILNRASFYIKEIFTQAAHDIVSDIVSGRPVPSLLRPK